MDLGSAAVPCLQQVTWSHSHRDLWRGLCSESTHMGEFTLGLRFPYKEETTSSQGAKKTPFLETTNVKLESEGQLRLAQGPGMLALTRTGISMHTQYTGTVAWCVTSSLEAPVLPWGWGGGQQGA